MLWRAFGLRVPKPTRHSGPIRLCSRQAHDDDRFVMPWASVGFTAAVLGGYSAYFYLIEQPNLPPEPEQLPVEVVRTLPDGRSLMQDGSIRRL